jgi:prepilin signal peptidase PulO-like enzyme (type II secretory pathway)
VGAVDQNRGESEDSIVVAPHRLLPPHATPDRTEHGWPTGPTARKFFVGAVATGLAALTARHVGVSAAIPAGFGLTILAATDLATRRLPSRLVFGTAVATGLFAARDASRSHSWTDFVIALAAAGATTIVAAVIWAVTSGIAFGDVKLLGVASFVPATVAPRLVLTMLFVALVASLFVVLAIRMRRTEAVKAASIAFAPPLLVGWFVAMMTS